MAAPVEVTGIVIAAGQSLSAAVDCTGGKLIRIIMPDEWTPANLSFQIAAVQAGPFHDLVDREGKEVLLPVVAGTGMLVPSSVQFNLGWVKFRSGPRTAPITQAAERTFSVSVDPNANL
jgi:hypothetical protein